MAEVVKRRLCISKQTKCTATTVMGIGLFKQDIYRAKKLAAIFDLCPTSFYLDYGASFTPTASVTGLLLPFLLVTVNV